MARKRPIMYKNDEFPSYLKRYFYPLPYKVYQDYDDFYWQIVSDYEKGKLKADEFDFLINYYDESDFVVFPEKIYNDYKEGILTLEEASELLFNFLRKGIHDGILRILGLLDKIGNRSYEFFEILEKFVRETTEDHPVNKMAKEMLARIFPNGRPALPQKLFPNDILRDYEGKKITTESAIKLLIRLIEESEDSKSQLECIDIINRIGMRSEEIFKILENLLISNEKKEVRIAAARHLIQNYPKESIIPIEWVITHGFDAILRYLVDLHENVDKSHSSFLSNLLDEWNALIEIEKYLKAPPGTLGFASDKGQIVTLKLLGFYKEKLPNIIGHLRSLKKLSISHFKFLTTIPSTIGNLLNLKELEIFACENLISLPSSIGELKNLKSFHIQNEKFDSLPNSIGNLSSLENLSLCECSNLLELPKTLCNIQTVQILKITSVSSLTCNVTPFKFEILPEEIGNFRNLEELIVDNCGGLVNVPESIKNLEKLRKLWITRCPLLKELPEGIGTLKKLESINFLGCTSLKSLPKSFKNLKNLKEVFFDENI